jgi:tetratricopeptide (TPR) repeat protein
MAREPKTSGVQRLLLLQNLFAIVTRLMSYFLLLWQAAAGLRTRSAAGRRLAARSVAASAVAAALLAGSGCEEIGARRTIQRANKLYGEGRFSQAVEEYETALKVAPHLAAGHHNAGLAYLKLFKPGDESPKNLSYANAAAQHLTIYLQSNPGDVKIIDLLTRLWVDSGNYQKALSYWEGELQKDPRSREVILRLAAINNQAGRYDEAVRWHQRRAEFETDPGAKAKAYKDIGQLQWHQLMKPDAVDEKRLYLADVGIAALQKAAALEPGDADVQTLLASLYEHRSHAHGASWARIVEAASTLQHRTRWRDLKQAGTPGSAPAGAPAGTAPAGTAPAVNAPAVNAPAGAPTGPAGEAAPAGGAPAGSPPPGPAPAGTVPAAAGAGAPAGASTTGAPAAGERSNQPAGSTPSSKPASGESGAPGTSAPTGG